jgi:hypothetical protein
MTGVQQARTGMADQVHARVEAARESTAYRNYLLTRERVMAMRDRESHDPGSLAAPSAYWREELENFDYMLDAHPLVVSKLRQHCYHVTGVRTYDYRSGKDRFRAQLEEKHRSLRAVGGRELMIGEQPVLGAFGFELDGGLFNVDTLKYCEGLIALRSAGILDQFRRKGVRGRLRRGAAERSVVWEIGAGWGGFAHHFKTVCPEVTYVISDFPELFLFSATYLMTVFPDARFLFEGVDDSGPEDWLEADFVFVSNGRIEAVVPPRLDLTVNMVSFQEMTTEQVEAYVGHAHRRGCPWLYSLNRERSTYNTELESVTSVLERYYEPAEVKVLGVSYVRTVREGRIVQAAKRLRAATVDDGRKNDYRHLVGTRRPTT